MKTRRIRIVIIVAGFILALLLAGSALAASSGTCGADGDNVTWTLDDNGTLTISGTGDMKDFYGNRPWSERPPATITKLYISDGITHIGSSAFSGLGISSLDLPDSLVSIGEFAFSSCSELTTLTIPDSVEIIGWDAFGSCSSLTSVTIPAGVRSMDNAFCFCTGLTSIQVDSLNPSYASVDGILCNKSKTELISYPGGRTDGVIPDCINRIGDYAFAGHFELTSLVIPESVTSIGERAFENCRNLTSITLSSGLVSIGEDAFWDCGIVSIVIPSSVSNISNGAFGYCRSLNTISVESNSPYFVTENGVLYNKGKTELVASPKNITDIIIPDTVQYIGASAFEECINLTSVTLPSNLLGIGDAAFRDCSRLTNVLLPDSLKNIGFGAFAWCNALSDVVLPVGLTNLGDYAFSGTKVNSITIPSAVTRIGESTFSGCSNLTNISIHSGVKEIGAYAFDGCSSLTSLVIPSSVTYIGDSAFASCSGLTNLTVPSSVTYIGKGAFSSCYNITSIELSEGLKFIGDMTFFRCESITDINIPSGVTSIGEQAFKSCTCLESVTMPDTVITLGDEAFHYCSALKTVSLSAQLKEIGEHAFGGCSNLSDIVLPESIISIGNNAFAGCGGLESIVIPENVVDVGEFAFCNCSSLESITIHGNITRIRNSAFSSCTKLVSIQIPDTLTTIESQAFYNCNRLNEVILPDYITSIDETAFQNANPRMYAKYGSDTSISVSKIGKGFYSEKGKQYSLMYVFTDNEITGLELHDADSYMESITISDEITCLSNWVSWNLSTNNIIYADFDSSAAKVLGKAGLAFTVPESNLKYKYLFTGDMLTGLELVKVDSDIESIVLPDNLTSIAENAFWFCSNLEELTIPATITNISESAFVACSNLMKVFFMVTDPDQIVNIATNAFSSIRYNAVFYCYRYTDPAIWCAQNNMPVIYIDDIGLDSIRTIEIHQEDFRMACGDTAELTVNMFPADGTEIVWTSSAPGVVGVEDGIVTALTEGTATITASVGQVSDSIVINTYIAATGFRLSETEMWIIVDDGSIQLDTVDFEPEGASATITWASSDTRYATVDNTGLVMPYKPGEVLITATTEKGISKQCLLHMCYPVSGVSLIAPQSALLMGDDMQLTANVTMNAQSCINHLVSFTSNDESIATVDSETGLLHAIAPGRVTITATSKNEKSSSISIKVNFDLEGRQILHLPADLQEIGDEAFSGLACEAVIIPDSCTTIGERAFAGCDQLLYVYIPTSVTNISADAFDGCDNAVFEYEHE